MRLTRVQRKFIKIFSLLFGGFFIFIGSGYLVIGETIYGAIFLLPGMTLFFIGSLVKVRRFY
ncbi:MAG: hypothetical protein H0Z29_02005 [Candidatus Marinimicrobia bacterium]|nr:hypothetical protein [Candidatus Neomarinimicrobiota bacterium]